MHAPSRVVFDLEIENHIVLPRKLQNFLERRNAARTIVLSFDPSTLTSLRRLDASIMMGLLVEGEHRDFVKSALDVGARQLCPRMDLVTRELVDQAHRSDLHVVTWTVNEAAKMNSVTHAGVDGIMTDLPDRLRATNEDKQRQA